MISRPRTRRSRRGRSWSAALLTVVTAAPAQVFAQVLLPPPSYESSVHLLFDAPGLAGPDDLFNASADSILSLPHGPYARLGGYRFVAVSMSWTQNPDTPVLSSPTYSSLAATAQRARSRGLEFHVALLGGMSRATSTYNAAFLEDRRNAQWFKDGTIRRDSPLMGTGTVWATPSRYARKLRRHMESKNREVARLLVRLRKEFPETFISASGDGEAELNYGGLEPQLPYQEQVLADYSPFAVLEFRDWIQHGGLYADGQPYAGQGFAGGGPQFQGDAGLAAFNAAYGTAFTTWALRFFDWSLDDPIAGDPGAIPSATYTASGWNPLPTSGPDFLEGGFDAPRLWGQWSLSYWQLWLRFRETMIHNYVKDYADWITTTPDTEGTTFEEARFFTHQIPADYVEGTYPGDPNPDPRLLTSASTLDTAFPARGRMGLTVFDVYTGTVTATTSLFLQPELLRRGIPSWGLMEYSPSWPVAGDDPDYPAMTARIHAMVDAGAHVINFHTWLHFFSPYYTSNKVAFTSFLTATRYQPRDSARTAYVPPDVTGVDGRHVRHGVELRWSALMAPGGAEGFDWLLWPDFGRFEVWAGPTPDFSPAQGRYLGDTRTTSFSTPELLATDRYFRVRALSRRGVAGALSQSWTGGFHILSPCRVLDTREATGAAAGAPSLPPRSERLLQLAGRCGIPALASAVSANVTVIQPGASGSLRVVPGDETVGNAQAVLFRVGRTVANNAILSLSSSGDGAVLLANDSPGNVDVVIDVNGYFR